MRTDKHQRNLGRIISQEYKSEYVSNQVFQLSELLLGDWSWFLLLSSSFYLNDGRCSQDASPILSNHYLTLRFFNFQSNLSQ